MVFEGPCISAPRRVRLAVTSQNTSPGMQSCFPSQVPQSLTPEVLSLVLHLVVLTPEVLSCLLTLHWPGGLSTTFYVPFSAGTSSFSSLGFIFHPLHCRRPRR